MRPKWMSAPAKPAGLGSRQPLGGSPQPDPDRSCFFFPLMAAFAMGLLLAGVLHAGWPHVGFDFRYFLPRLVDVRLHQLEEGWFRLQWWTPSFGAGLPGFPNPQHTQFMLAQFLLPMLGPWGAAIMQAAFFNALGSAVVYHTCHRRLGCDRSSALLAGVTFGTCGFMWEHALSGHMSFNMFPLIALIPEALHRDVPAIRGGALLGLTGAVIVLGGGYTVIITYALTALLLATLLPLFRPAEYPFCASFGRLSFGAAAAGLAAAAKIAAVTLFLARFPRLSDYRFEGQVGWEVPSLLWQLFGRQAFLLLSRWLPFSGNEANGWLGRGEDVGYGPVAAVVLAAGGMLCLLRCRRPGRARWHLWLGAMAAIWLTAEFTLGQGILWTTLEGLPLLRSLGENHRLAAAFALPLALAIAPCWQALMRGRATFVRRGALVAALIGTISSLEYYARSRDSFWYSSYDAAAVTSVWQRMRDQPGERFPIVRIADTADDASFTAHASSLKPYEPIFGYGYGGSEFRTELQAGPIEKQASGPTEWRFHDPRSFLEIVGREQTPFSLLTDEAAIRQLLARRQPDWALPMILRVARGLSVATLAVLIAALFWPTPRSWVLRRLA